MTIVVDTSVLIRHLRGEEQAHAAVARAVGSGQRLTASVLTKIEVLAGMRAHEVDATRRLFDSIEWIEVDDSLAERAGALANQFLGSHPGIDPVDFVIAATTERLGAELWTLNVRHFPMFPGLTPPF